MNSEQFLVGDHQKAGARQQFFDLNEAMVHDIHSGFILVGRVQIVSEQFTDNFHWGAGVVRTPFHQAEIAS